MLVVSMKEQFKIDVVCRVTQGKIKRWQAQKLLDVSESTLRRYIRKFEKVGILFAKHGNWKKRPPNQKPEDFKERILLLIREKYHDFNMTHLRQTLKEIEGIEIARETLRRWCHGWKTVKRQKRRRASPHFYRERMPQTGMMLQLDGSHHDWFGGYKSVLIACIDDATNEIPYAEFCRSEDTLNCMKVVQRIVEKRGLFQVLYTDRAGIYGGAKRQDSSQLKRACDEIGINLIYAHSPEAKGRIERLFQTLQDRLIPEMRLKNIQTMDQANDYLHSEFLPKHYTPRFTMPPRELETAYRPWNPKLDLHEVFCIKEHRLINNDHTIHWNGAQFAIKSKLTHSLAGQYVEIRHYQNGTAHPYFNNQPIEIKFIQRGAKFLFPTTDTKSSYLTGIKPVSLPGR